ncbi:MAG: class I SAM-dependent methyltransferase, partial [Oscillospiraceae bacterium]|nr:class I SAM-dependent methyltransferase [Oscillospiraceae bacterium]
IARDDIKLTMLDSLNKRINFLNEVTTQIGVDVLCIHSRAEEGGRQALYREKYFIGTARAVAHLRELAEYCLPFVEVGGYFISLKGGEIDAELDEAKNAIKILGGKVEAVKKVTLPDGSGRSFIIIKKISQTPTNYPRPSAKMAKKPLK